MSIFGNIMKKIFHPEAAKAAPAAPSSGSPSQSPPVQSAPVQPAPTASAPAPSSSAATVDVGAVLEAMSAMKPDGGGNYRSSIVDLLKLLDLDSSLSARRELGEELGVHAGADGTAEQNVALHRAVMAKLAENGGIVPDALRH